MVLAQKVSHSTVYDILTFGQSVQSVKVNSTVLCKREKSLLLKEQIIRGIKSGQMSLCDQSVDD